MRRRALLRLVPVALVLLWPLAVPSTTIAAPQARAGDAIDPSASAASRALAVSAPDPGPTDGRLLLRFQNGSALDHFGGAAANAGDVNGDGRADLAVGAAGRAGPGDGIPAGSVYLYWGGPQGNNVPEITLHGTQSGEGFGSSIASTFHGGSGLLLVGARFGGLQQRGRVYLYSGYELIGGLSLGVIGAPLSDRGFGASVAALGDVNGGGGEDFIVGAPGLDGDGQNRGHAYIYSGGLKPILTLIGSGPNDHFGAAVASAGDFNGDGFPDFIVGETVGGSAGRASLYYGGPGVDAVPDQIFQGEAAGDHFGAAISSMGDLNGDGYDDLAIAAPFNDAAGQDAGRVYVFFGGPAADALADLVLTGERPGDNFGQSVAAAGDMNSDGHADFVVGAPVAAVGDLIAGPGSAYVYFGGPLLDDTPDLVLNGETNGDHFGAAVAMAGDFNDDGGADLLVGAPSNDFAGTEAGRSYLFTTWSHPPAVRAPSTVVAGTRLFLDLSVSVVDAEGDPIASLTAGPIPAGATFTVSPGNRSGSLQWTPTDLQVGTYDVTFTAANLESGSATTRIQVVFHNSPPALNPFAAMTAFEGSVTEQTLSGFDQDGDPLAFQLVGAPTFAALAPLDPFRALVRLAPDYGDAGAYVATVRIEDGHGGTASAPLSIAVEHVNRGPVLSAPAGVSGPEGGAIVVAVQASDPDGDPVTLGAVNQPPGSLFVDHGDNSGTFSWTPGYEQAGTYQVTFTARDELGALGAPWDLTIDVENRNRGPAAVAGGPYAGVINVPIVFDATGSSDPDGSALTYQWDFGDLASGTGATPSHAYAAGGTFAVGLTVSDGDLSGQAITSAAVQDIFAARAFVEPPNRTIRLGSAKATWCAEVEPAGNSFLMNAVLPSAVVMRYGGGQIAGIAERVGVGADLDANGVAEMTICFSKADLRALLTGLPKGITTVPVTLEGSLSTGGKFRAPLSVDVASSGGSLAASLSPNPLNPSGMLTFSTSRRGRVRVAVFDLRGRLVRTLLPAQELDPGYHDVPLDGRGGRGASLSSGAYFYRIEAADGVATGRFVILK